MKYDRKKAFLIWDTSEIIENEVKYRLEEDNPDKLDEDTIREQVYSGDILFIMQEDLTYELTVAMKKINPSGYWKAKVENFGWRGISGKKVFKAFNGNELLSEILPKTENTFFVWKTRTGFVINNFHHDSRFAGTSGEWYYIDRMTQKDIEKEFY